MEYEESNWMPLESNPEVINEFIKNLGFDVNKYKLVDVFSIEEWAQDMIPKPVKAVFFLYPISSVQEDFRKAQNEEIVKSGQKVADNLFFMKQYAGNACGTVAVVHAIVNIADNEEVAKSDSFFSRFKKETKDNTAEERGRLFEKSEELKAAHTTAVNQGVSAVEENVDTHFIAFIEKNGHLYELDGRKSFPINHGECKEDELLAKACETVKKFMERDPEENKFTIMALAAPGEEEQ